jgi:hypothetical protein
MSQSVDIPKRWPLVADPQNRAALPDKDARLVNGFVEFRDGPEGKKTFLYQRPGLLRYTQPSGGAAIGLGVFNWLGDIYSIFGGILYKNLTPLGIVQDTAGVYTFGQCLGATPQLILWNGVQGYTYDSGGGLQLISDVDFPSTSLKGFAYLDATVYIGTPTAHIQGSDPNAPATWDPVNDILAQIEPDQGRALAKQLVYVLMLKEWSTEVFYDAGNAIGSPLGPVQGAKMNYGCVASDTVQDIDGTLFWVCSSRTAGVQVAQLDNLKLDLISTAAVERLLKNAPWDNCFSWQIATGGHRFYVLTNPEADLTLAYDLDQKLWSQWTGSDGGWMQIVASTYDSDGKAILQHRTNGRLYYSDVAYTSDDDEFIDWYIITPNFDGGVQGRGKFLSRLFFVGDRIPGCTLEVRYNDNDFDSASWSEPQLVDMGQRTPYLDNQGSFDSRSYWIRKRSNTAFRLEALEMQVDLCTLPVGR